MVIPIHDENPVRRTPVVIYLLIALNFLVFFTEPLVFAPGVRAGEAQVCRQVAYFQRWAAIPDEITSGHQLRRVVEYAAGPQGPVCEVGVRPTFHKSPALSILFAMFLHGGWLHILGNMLFLYIFGNNVEDRFGRLRFLVFYLAAGYLSAYAFAYAYPSSTAPLIGASGAIAGALGAYLVLFPRARVTSLVPFLFFLPFRLPAWVVLGFWFLLQWLYSAGTTVASGAGVAYLAHVVGFGFGVLVGLLARAGSRPPPRPAWA